MKKDGIGERAACGGARGWLCNDFCNERAVCNDFCKSVIVFVRARRNIIL